MARVAPLAEYSIAAVSKLTGISCHALRVWERRYGYPKPHRSASNQRRYSPEQVHVLRALAEMAREGRAIGELIADYVAGKIAIDLGHELPGRVAVAHRPSAPPAGLVDALMAGDLAEADRIMDPLVATMIPTDLLTRVLDPALVEVGERWFNKEAEIYQEHFATGVLINWLGRLLNSVRLAHPPQGPRAIVASVQGDRHQGGVLILSIGLELMGWRALDLGVDLPVSELRRAIDAWKPDAVGVSFVLSRNINKRFRELSAIRSIPVMVGGRSLMNHKGLARRYGLVPLPGSISTALTRWPLEFAKWRRSPEPERPISSGDNS